MASHTSSGNQSRHQAFEKVWGNLPGWGALSAVNHTTVGLRFLVTGLMFFLVGGLLAMLIRTQLALPEQDIIGVDLYNQLFTMHGTVMMFLFAIPVLEGAAMYLRFGRKASPNPWRADTLEWAIPMPVNAYNFASIPEIRSRHPLWDQPELMESIAAGEHRLSQIGDGRRDTMGSDAITGEPLDVIHLPSNSWEPLVTAALLAGLCLSLLLKVYVVAVVVALLVLLACLRWSWVNGLHPPMAPRASPSADATDLPLHSRTTDGPGRWGMVVTLMANGTLFASLLFGWLYLWPVAPQWAMPSESPLSTWGLLASGALLTGALGLWWRQVRGQVLVGGLLLAAAVGAGHCGLLVVTALTAGLTPTDSAHDSVLAVVLCYLIFHGGLTTLLTAMQALRVRHGFTSADLPYELRVLHPLWLYTTGIYWISIAVFLALPVALGGGQ